MDTGHKNRNVVTGLYRQGITKDEYVVHLVNLLWPTYQAAKNQGFTEWHMGR